MCCQATWYCVTYSGYNERVPCIWYKNELSTEIFGIYVVEFKWLGTLDFKWLSIVNVYCYWWAWIKVLVTLMTLVDWCWYRLSWHSVSLFADNGKEGATVNVTKKLFTQFERAEELFSVPSSIHVYRVFYSIAPNRIIGPMTYFLHD